MCACVLSQADHKMTYLNVYIVCVCVCLFLCLCVCVCVRVSVYVQLTTARIG